MNYRIFLTCLFATFATFSFAQSKKTLLKDNETLKAQVDSLNKALLESQAKPELDLEDQNQRVSYAIGVQIGDNFLQQGLDSIIDLEILSQGISEAVEGQGQLNKGQVQDEMKALSERMRAIEQAKRDQVAADNLKKGQDFLEENAKRPEVTTTASGLQYEVLIAGTGPIPSKTDRIKAHYTGTLLDGTVFDSSIGRQPLEASAGSGLIQGWLEALQMMPEGSKWKLYIPAELAYGQRGAGGNIGPNETLIFEMELVEIVGK